MSDEIRLLPQKAQAAPDLMKACVKTMDATEKGTTAEAKENSFSAKKCAAFAPIKLKSIIKTPTRFAALPPNAEKFFRAA